MCGLSRSTIKDDIEESPLLGTDPSLSDGAGTLPTRQPSAAESRAERPDRKVIIMRHGHRQDEEDPLWHRNAKRPWDPPLSDKGRAQVTTAGVYATEAACNCMYTKR